MGWGVPGKPCATTCRIPRFRHMESRRVWKPDAQPGTQYRPSQRTIQLVHLKSLLSLALFAAPLLACAQTTTHIEFDSPRHFVTYVSPKPPEGKPAEMDEHDGGSADVTLPGSGTLYVWDRSNGNLAAKAVGDAGKLWHVTSKDLSKIGIVSVQVQYQGEPVAAARVSLKDKAREQSQILDRSAEGEADFYAIQPGTIYVTVEYRSGGTAATPVVQQFTLDLDRHSPDPLLTVALPNRVETITPVASASAATAPATKAAPARHVNLLGAAFVYLVALAAAVAAAYWLYLWAMKNPDWLAARLKKAGVDIPQPQAPVDDTVVVADVEPPKPAPPSKIILGDAEPIAAPVSTMVSHEPRLVGAHGQTVQLAQGEMIVGREAGLGLSLVGESSVSRHHASITRQGSSVSVKDLGSTNGTFVNGRRIDTDVHVSPGDEIQFGAVKFRLEG
jgi:hypothetical protein